MLQDWDYMEPIAKLEEAPLNFSRRTIWYTLLKSESFPATRIGAKWYVLRDKLIEWLENGGTLQDEKKVAV